LSLNESHLLVPEASKMFERKACRPRVVEDDVRHSRHFPVSRNSHARNIHSFRKRRIDNDQAFHRSLLQQQRIFFDKFIPVAMAHHKIKIAFLQQVILDAGHHQCRIALADLRDDHADGEAALLPQGPGEMVRPVV
jgi:hypothetical protein